MASRLNRYLNENHITYAQYLASDHWKDVRQRFMACRLHNKACFVCGSREHLNVHHRSYKRVGHEWLNDLVLLCQTCHHRTHEILKTQEYGQVGLRNAAKRLRRQTGILKGHPEKPTRIKS